jgi:hypothetical protein
MHEPSRPGASDRLSPNDPSGLQRRLTAILQASPAPTICVARSREEGGDLMVAGASLLELIRHRVGALQRAGMRSGDVLASDAVGVGRVVDALAAIIGGFVYWPCDDYRRIVTGPLVSDSGASLVWRPNPLVSAGASTTAAHEPPAALPMRLSTHLRDLMQPAGPRIRLLVDGNAGLSPFAVNAQTIGRLGGTLRRRLGLKPQSVRYCAAPAQSAVGVLLDLVPGIVARQVMVVPSEAAPSSTSIVRAIGRYHPDALTLTLEQATALADTPIDAPTLHALQQCQVLIADTHPIPTALRARFTEWAARLDVAYILPEAGDAFLL